MARWYSCVLGCLVAIQYQRKEGIQVCNPNYVCLVVMAAILSPSRFTIIYIYIYMITSVVSRVESEVSRVL